MERGFTIQGKAESTLRNYPRCLAHMALHYKISPENLDKERIHDYLYDKESVTFKYTDYRHANKVKVMRLSAPKFMRRIILHFLPKRFTRIRHYGILSSQWKKKLFAQKIPQVAKTWKEIWESKGLVVDRCPHCKKGKIFHLSEIKPTRGPPIYQNFSKDKASHSSQAIAVA